MPEKDAARAPDNPFDLTKVSADPAYGAGVARALGIGPDENGT